MEGQKEKKGESIEYSATYEEPEIKHASFLFKCLISQGLSPVSAVQVSLGVLIHLSGQHRLVCRGCLHPILLFLGR